jgi:hypothetical protein
MDAGYQEHLDHEMGAYPNELAAAYDLSRREARLVNDSVAIAAALAAGKVVLVNEWTSYCRFTDAILGGNQELEAVYDSVADIPEDLELFGDDEGGRRLIFPRNDKEPEPLPVLADEDIPF